MVEVVAVVELVDGKALEVLVVLQEVEGLIQIIKDIPRTAVLLLYLASYIPDGILMVTQVVKDALMLVEETQIMLQEEAEAREAEGGILIIISVVVMEELARILAVILGQM